MKKLLAGCLVIAVLGGVALAGAAYFLYRAASPLLEDARSYLESYGDSDALERKLENQVAFTAPATGELTAAQVDRFVRVQDAVGGALGERMQAIEQKYERLRAEDGDSQPSFGELLSGLRDLGGVMAEAREYQVQALNKERFSRSEYSWVRNRVFEAAGLEATSRIDLSKIQEAIKNGAGDLEIDTSRLPTPDVPARNRELVAPHLQRMNKFVPLAFFGL